MPAIGYANVDSKKQRFVTAGATTVVTTMADVANILLEAGEA